LIRRLADDDRVVRIVAVDALGQIGPAARSAVGPLISAANSYPDLKGSVSVSLSRIDREAAPRLK
jgi:HEAT repeat protein